MIRVLSQHTVAGDSQQTNNKNVWTMMMEYVGDDNCSDTTPQLQKDVDNHIVIHWKWRT